MKYIIMEKGWQYNDQGYDPEEGGKAIFFSEDKKKAKERCLEMERIIYSGMHLSDLTSYANSEGWVDLETNEKINKILNIDNKDNDFDQEDFDLKHITEKQFNQLKKLLKIEFYEVVGVNEL